MSNQCQNLYAKPCVAGQCGSWLWHVGSQRHDLLDWSADDGGLLAMISSVHQHRIAPVQLWISIGLIQQHLGRSVQQFNDWQCIAEALCSGGPEPVLVRGLCLHQLSIQIVYRLKERSGAP